MSFTMQSRLFTRLENLQLIPQFQPLVKNLLLPTIQKIKIMTNLILMMRQIHWIMLLLESASSVERTDVSNVISLTVMKFTNL